MSNRREFLLNTAGALAAGTIGPGGIALSFAGEKERTTAAIPLRILMIGGAGFTGSHHVHAAVARGHTVTVLDRAKKMELPTTAEVLIGDRYQDLKLIQGRDWDAVVDLAAFGPEAVRGLGQALGNRIKHYTLISTCMVYQRKEHGKLTEDSPLLKYAGSEDPYTLTFPRGGNEYGELKALCEAEANKQFSGKTLIFRPGYIIGPGDAQGHFNYWTLRVEKGGEMLAAGEPTQPVQFVDARDMADWCMRMVERRATGIYNVVGPAAPLNLGQFIQAMGPSNSGPPKITWVPGSWLAAQESRDLWSKLLYWTLEEGGVGWVMRMDSGRAQAAGLAFRPMEVTRADTFAWFKKQPEQSQAQLIAVHRKKESGSGFDVQNISWPEYLEREKEVLQAWHAYRSKHS